jgi:DNA repair protein SbcC/Rad50
MKGLQHKSKLYYSSQSESSWNSKKTEFDSRLKEIKTLKNDLISKKKTVETLKKQPSLDLKKSPEELEVLLRLSQEEHTSLSKTLKFEREKSFGIESDLEDSKLLIKDLESKNRSLQAQLLEKDRTLSRYVCEMLILKQEIEKLVKPSSGICDSIKNSLSLLYKNEPKQEIIPIEPAKNDWISASVRSPRFYENEIARLQKQLSETQNLFKVTNQQLVELSEKNSRQQSEFSKTKTKLQDTKTDFGSTSSQILRSLGEKDLHAKTLMAEIDELRKKKDDLEVEVLKMEKKHQFAIAEVETDLNKSRGKLLELMEEKSKLDVEVHSLRNANKELSCSVQSKDQKIADLNLSYENLSHEHSILKSVVKTKSADNPMDSKARQNYERRISDLQSENIEMTERVKFLENERKTFLVDKASNTKAIVQQLSNIILSRDTQTNISSDLGRQLSKLLVDNYNIFRDILDDYFGRDFSKIESELQERVDECNEIIEELKAENSRIHQELKTEKQKCREMKDRAIKLEGEVKSKENSAVKNKRTTSVGEEMLQRLLEFDGVETEKGKRTGKRIETLTTEMSEAWDDGRKPQVFQRKLDDFLSQSDLLCFLQCEAAALDDILEEDQS